MSGSVFHGRLLGPAGERWADPFDLSRLPAIHELAALVLEVRATEPTPAALRRRFRLRPRRVSGSVAKEWLDERTARERAPFHS